jgi:hypothetical protein
MVKPEQRHSPTHEVIHRNVYEVRLTLPDQDVPDDHYVIETLINGDRTQMTLGDWHQFVGNVNHANRQIMASIENVPAPGRLPGVPA